MPAAHGRSSSVFLNAYNVSAFLSSFDSTQTVDTAEVTTFGSTSKSFVTGLRDGTITLGGYFDGGAAALDEIMTLALNDQQVLYTPLVPTAGTIGETLLTYATNQNVSEDTATPIQGFPASISFSDNTATRFITRGYTNKVTNSNYILAAYIRMNDGSAPVVNISASDVDGLWEGNLVKFTKVQQVSGTTYRVSRLVTASTSVSGTIGIYKASVNSAKGFRTSGLTLSRIDTTAAANPVLSICEDGALTIGNRCLVANVIDTSYQITGSISEAVSISAEFQANGEGASGAYRGIVLAPLAAYSNGQNTTASDNSAATSNGLVANLHVLNAGGNTTVKVQHSTDNSTWTDLITFTTGAIQFSEHGVSTGTVHRYLRVNVTTDGLSQMLVTVARK